MKGMNLVLVFFFSLLLQAEDRIQIKATWAGLKDAHLSGQLDDQVGPVGNPYNLVNLLQWENGEKVAPAEFNNHDKEFWYLPKSAKADGKAAHQFLLAASGSATPAAKPEVSAPVQAEKKVLVTEDLSLKLKIQSQNDTIRNKELKLEAARKQLEETRIELQNAKNQVLELKAKVESMNESTVADTRYLVAKVTALEKENTDLRRQLEAAKAAAKHVTDAENGGVPAATITKVLLILLIFTAISGAVYYFWDNLLRVLKKDRQKEPPKTEVIKKATKSPALPEVSVSQLINLDESVRQIAMGTVAKAFLEMKDGDGGSIEVSVATSHAQDTLVDALKQHLGSGFAVTKLKHTGHRQMGTATYHVSIVPIPAQSKVFAINQA